MPISPPTELTIAVAGTNVHLWRGGNGPPLLLLQDDGGNPPWLSYHQALAERFTVYMPSHPGFGRTSRPEWVVSIDDMALVYFWLLEHLGLPRVHLVGHGLGGWMAAHMATTCPHSVDRLVLVGAMGIKPQHSEIFDIFLITPQQVREMSFHRPAQVPAWEQLYGRPPTPEEANRDEDALEMTMRLAWKPYMHAPRLPFVLPRLRRPTLIVWGRHDAIVPLECGTLYQQAIAGAQLVVVEDCGHSLHLEKPQACSDAVLTFLCA